MGQSVYQRKRILCCRWNIYQRVTEPGARYPVLRDISIDVERGEFVAVMGPSGSGKTTLLNCISRFVPFDEGAVLLGGQDISALREEELAEVRNRKMGFVFQDFMLQPGSHCV